MPKALGDALTARNRELLGTISVAALRDGEPLPADPAARKEAVARLAAVMDLLQPMLEYAIAKQADYAVRTAPNWDLVLVARGGINYGALLEEWLAELVAEHQQNVQPPEPFDPHAVV